VWHSEEIKDPSQEGCKQEREVKPQWAPQVHNPAPCKEKKKKESSDTFWVLLALWW
jgi:hypothetical protein